jgi:hypothetical protein
METNRNHNITHIMKLNTNDLELIKACILDSITMDDNWMRSHINPVDTPIIRDKIDRKSEVLKKIRELLYADVVL